MQQRGDPSFDLRADVEAVGRIGAVPTILEVVCRTTGMRFAAVARVTAEHWVACAVRDDIDFGLVPGGELQVATTLCNEVQEHRETIAIDHVAEDAVYCGHPTPAQYGFQSYVSTPIILKDGSFFGTLCAIDPKPAKVKTPETVATFKLFAELIAFHLDALDRIETSEAGLRDERKTAELREQFIAVLGHDLRNPLGAIAMSAQLLAETELGAATGRHVERIRRSAVRMSGLIDDVLDFARGRLGAGLSLSLDHADPLEAVLKQVASEVRTGHPDRVIELDIDLTERVRYDRSRLGQLVSNLLANAVAHGAASVPIRLRARTEGDELSISVTNGGEPIPSALLPHLFHPFFRGSVRPSQQGLGLGLYIASEIARAHGGTIEVRSTPESTSFTFRMPLS